MLIQGSRFIIKNYKNIQKGIKAQGLMEYLNNIQFYKGLKCQVSSIDTFLDNGLLLEALKVRAAVHVDKVMSQFVSSPEQENRKINDIFGYDLIAMTKTHSMYMASALFLEQIEAISKIYRCPMMKRNILLLHQFFMLDQLQEDSHCLYVTGYFD